ncbi:MAG: GntR family transcriptional regulator [Chthoniobacterales bacterium]
MITTPKDQITDSLRGRILARELGPGHRVKEEALAVEFGVGRGPIRDVVLRLSKEGYLLAHPNKGASVNALPNSDVRSLFLHTRRDLEILALRKGFPTWKLDDLPKLDRILREFRVAAEMNDLAEVIRHDVAFHRFIVERYPGNGLSILWLPLMTTLALPYSRHANLLESHAEHVAIYQSLADGDARAAAALLKQHIQ